MSKDIDFAFIGIAEVFKRHPVEVPPNQREYSWTDYEVSELLKDLASAMKEGNEYFLGTVVLTKTRDGKLQVADGQQRLATVTMILATIRDRFHKLGDEMVVQDIENSFLFGIDARKREKLPKLSLNTNDNTYYWNIVLDRPDQRQDVRTQVRSNRLISDAANTVRNYFQAIETEFGPKHFQDAFLDWKEYLATQAKVIILTFETATNAFRVFETANDRGLDTSQADLVKNYLFEKADERIRDAEAHWSSMRGAISTVGEADFTMEYLRLACCVLSGATREKDIMDRVQEHARGRTQAIRLLQLFDEMSADYAAILNPEHQKWNDYDEIVGKSIHAINVLGVTQIRPLLLSVARTFSPAQAAIAFPKMVSWSVRFLIVGGRGGKLDEGYAKLANEIHKGKIKNFKDLLAAASDRFVPSDAQFKSEFERARVTVSRLARYYLRCLETTARKQPDAELIPNEDLVITLEHIMPQKYSPNLSPVTAQDIETHCSRLGNLALLQAKKNVEADRDFKTKREAYKQSGFLLTNQLAQRTGWGTADIEERQKVLAELALKTWPLD